MAVTFYIVRHGETLLNSLNRAQGWSDSPLTDNGNNTAIELGNKLKGTAFKAVFTSDTIRAIQTAELILSMSGNDNIKIQDDRRLREWCLGIMEGENNSIFVQTVSKWLGGVSSFAELNKRLADVASEIYHHDTTGMAEPFSDILKRLKSVFFDMAELYDDGGNILVVTHAFAIKTLFYLFSTEQLSTMDKVKNATIFKLEYNQGNFIFQHD